MSSFLTIEATTTGVLYEQVFFKILQNLKENTCTRFSFLIKSQA